MTKEVELNTQKPAVSTVMLALIAMAALYVTSNGYEGLIALAIGLIGTLVLRERLPASPLLAWAIRVAVFGAILVTTNPDRHVDTGSMAFDPAHTNLFGFLCTGEMVIRAWIRRKGGPSKGEMVLLSALILTAATNTASQRAIVWIRILAPIYVIFLVMTLRRFRKRPGGISLGWIAAMLAAVGIGMTSSWAVSAFEGQITRLSMQFLSGKSRQSASIGLGRTATLGKVFNPEPSDQRILKLERYLGAHHLRVMAFDQYAGGTWGPPIDQRSSQALQQQNTENSANAVWVTRYANAFGLLCLPLETVGLHVEGEGVELQQDADGDVRADGEDSIDPTQYSFAAGQENTQGVIARTLGDDQRRLDLDVPKDVDAGVKELAEQVAFGSPAEKLARIQLYLRANHHYSLEIDPGEGDPISAFLLKKMDGHCEYFAASAVMMARCVGVPARYVTGYYSHEPDGNGGTVVRERDAHAWAECWVDGVGWETVDATPAGGRPDALFSETSAWRKVWEHLQDWVAGIRAWLGRRTLMEGAEMIALLAAVPMVIRVWKGRTERKRKISLTTRGPAIAELAEIYRRFEKLLKKRHISCPPTKTWQEHLSHQPRCVEFIRQYNALRFGGEGSSETLVGILTELERDLGSTPRREFECH